MTTATKTKNQLIFKRDQLLENINDINQELRRMEDMEKPYVAAISGYSGGGETRFKTEEQAQKKFQEYCKKTYYRNGLAHGAFLYKLNDDGSKFLIDSQPIGQKDFFPYQFDKNQKGRNSK